MGRRTGNPRGRPKGARNKKSHDFEAALAAKAKEVDSILQGAFEGDAHAYLMSIYRDPTMPVDKRIDAAKASMPFEKPRLASVEHKGDAENPLAVHMIEIVAAEPTPDEGED